MAWVWYCWVDCYNPAKYTCTYTKISSRFLSLWLSLTNWPMKSECAILVAVMSECRVKSGMRKTWTGTLANSADPDRHLKTRHLIRVCTVCLNYGKLRVKWNSLKTPIKSFAQLSLRDNQPTSAVSAFIFLYSMNMVKSHLLSRNTLSSTIIGVIPREPVDEDKVICIILL